jgi:tRNA(His) guanylyltransferase
MTGKDDLGDRMKGYERHETGRRFLPMLPVYARIDGRGFSKFTKGMNRPFDQGMTEAMIETTMYLVRETHALIGYVQSDEISLVWKAPDYTGSIFFDGKITKMTSVLAAMATAGFGRAIRGWEPYEDRYPAFDARVLQLPLDYEAANMFLWRAIDCRKNAVSMATRAHYSAKQMHGQSSRAMLEMLSNKGVDFSAYPVAFREGTFVRRVLHELPHPFDNEKETVIRAKVEVIPMPPFQRVANRTEVIIGGADPILMDEKVTQ